MLSESGSKKKISLEEFHRVKKALVDKLTSRLEIEAALSDFDTEEFGDSDVFDNPGVDSKSVIKLSPIIEEATGEKVKPEWIKPGGYETVGEAVSDLMRQLELNFKAVEEPGDE